MMMIAMGAIKKTSKVSAGKLSSDDPNRAQVYQLSECDWWDGKAIPHLDGLDAHRENFMR